MKKERTGKYRRVFAVLLCMCMLFTAQPEIWNSFSVFAAEKSDTKVIFSFAELEEGIKEQTVPVGTGYEELGLPEELTVLIRQEENSSAPDTDTEEDKEETETNTEETDAEEDSAGEKGNDSEADGKADESGEPENDPADGEVVENGGEAGEAQETADGENADESLETDAPEQAAEDLPAEDETETNTETVMVEQEEYYAEPEEIAVYTLKASEKGTQEIKERVTGVTWQSDPAYDGSLEGTYIFTVVLPDGYVLAEGVSLPQITVRVEDGESGTDAVMQVLLERIAALPDAEEYLAAEPDVKDEEAYLQWEEKLYEYAEEALAIWEEYEALMEEQQALVSEKALAKLTAWTEIAGTVGESRKLMAAAQSGTCGDNLTWTLSDNGVLTISGTGAMTDYGSGIDSPFESNKDIKKVVIKEGVTSIGNRAFIYCDDLTDVTIPEGVTSIGENAFQCCSLLTAVALPKTMKSIGESAFTACTTLTAVTIPGSVESIGGYAFSDCDSLSTVTFQGTTTIPTLGNSWVFLRCPCVKDGAKGIYIPCQFVTDYQNSGDSPYNKYESNIALMHTELSYTADGAVITQSCACGEGSATATLSVDSDADLTYTGSAVKPVQVTYSEDWAEEDGNKPGNDAITYENNTSPGTATAKLTIGGATAQISFTIAAPPHVHDGGMTFDQALPANGGNLASGNYYLADNVELKNCINIQSGAEVNLCLSGHTLYGPGSNYTVKIYGGTLNVYNCDGNGVLTGDNRAGTSKDSAIYMEDGTFNLYGGKITSSSSCVISTMSKDSMKINLFGGAVEGGSAYAIYNRGTIVISGNSKVISSKGYAVYNYKSSAVLTVKDNASLSGVKYGIYNNPGTVNIEGGTITGTGVEGRGIENNKILNLAGGTVTGDKYGIHMITNFATLKLSGSPTVSGGTADLYLQTGSNVTLDNAKVDAAGYTGDALTVEEGDLHNVRIGSYAIKTGEENKDKFTLTDPDGEWWYSYKDGGLYLDNHIHEYAYYVSYSYDNVIIEKCNTWDYYYTCGHEETATLSLKEGADLTYTGNEIKPVTVTYSDGWAGTGTNKPDDSGITYSNNTNAGTATAKLTISGKTASLDFTISARSIDGASVALAGYGLTYNGKEQTQGVKSVKVNGKTLTAGTDYTVSGNTGKDAGTYTITITGEGNYSGTKEVTFTIEQTGFPSENVSIAPGPYYYTGNPICPDVTVDAWGGYKLPDTDYTVSYENNVEPGEATVTVTGKGNNIISNTTATVYFTIECRPLPSGKNLTDYVSISPSPNDGWYSSDITLTPKNGGSVGETPAGIGDSVVISEETGTDGETKTIYVKDSDGNIYQTQFLYKLDKTPPVIDLVNMSVVNGTKGLWNRIIGKKSMIIKIPAGDIADALSGMAEVTYTAEPDSGAKKSGKLSAKGGYYEIALNAEFSGTIRLTAKDKAGNTTQVSLTADGGKVIAEDYAPVVTITVPDTPQPNANGWYNTAVTLTVTVTDDKDSGNNSITSGGIAGIKWKDGENGTEQSVTGLPGASPVYSKTFTITADTDGTHTYYVQATDNAGNESGWKKTTVRLDTGSPAFSGTLSVTNRTQEGADITFTPSEGGKAYWIASDDGTTPDAQAVVAGVQGGAGKGGAKDITGGSPNTVAITGLTPGEKHTVYVVLEDAAGNLSEVKEVSFTTLQKAPEVTLDDLTIDHGKETVKLPEGIGEVEVYTDSGDPSGSRIEPGADGSLPVEPGTLIYIRYPEKTEEGETTPASDSAKIRIPGRPAAPAPKQTAVTDTTVTVTNPAAGEEYVLVKKGSLPEGQEPDWSGANTTGRFTGLDPSQEYDLYARKKATGNSFASEPAKTEVRTSVPIEEPIITGEGAGQEGNTAPRPDAPRKDGSTVTFTGTYGEEYTPVVKIDGQTFLPGEGTPGSGMAWDENSGKGKWEYTYNIPDDASSVQITVEFKKRAAAGITAEPGSLAVYADDAANGSREALTAYLKDRCRVQAVYDNGTKGTVQASFATADKFVQKGAAYNYTASAEGKDCKVTLTVQPVTASIQSPDTVTQRQKDGGYTAQEVNTWLPPQVTVTYTGTGYTTRTEKLAATWDMGSIGAGFGGTPGEKTVNGTAELPPWATGQASVGITVRFEGSGSNSSGNGTDNNHGGGNGNNASNNSGNDADGEGNSNVPGNNNNSGTTATPPSPTAAPLAGTPKPPAQADSLTQTDPLAQANPRAQADPSRQAATSAQERPADTSDSQQADQQKQGSAAAQQGAEELSRTEKGQQPEEGGKKTVPASLESGRLVASGGTVATGSVEGMAGTSTALESGDGAVIVTVVCPEEEYKAGVTDTAAVANAVLTPEQMGLISSGETIEIRIDVKDISGQVPEKDRETIEKGIEEYRKETPELVLGGYVDISMFIKIGEGDWDAVSETEEPIEIVVEIPESLQEKGRTYVIIRAHGGVHTLMEDLDDDPNTITVSTDMFSSYAIAYVQSKNAGHECSLCHICPTFLGICCFVWLAIIIFIMIIVILYKTVYVKNRR